MVIITGSVEGSFESAFPSTPSQARAIMLHNIATVFCLRRENDKARNALHQVSLYIIVFLYRREFTLANSLSSCNHLTPILLIQPVLIGKGFRM